jgi:protein-S-isoprenylcysteine O-methyltransferase Ste14
MSFYMELELGLWNAWIGSLIAWATPMIMAMFYGKAVKRLTDMSWYTSKDKVAAYSCMFMMYFLMIFSIWVPLKFGTVWFYSGLIFYLAGLLFSIIALHNYATTPGDEAIVKGMYRLSRNPLYFFHSLMMLGLCVASASLPMFVFWIVYNIPTHFIILGEERYCMQTYGMTFQEYMNSVPRYFMFF